mmetsp:Transcript_46125/g.76861  ORF Transcript_46125/g.76861 Transcript_46125/m.76861 type:complete len:524 (-) Transcript_46125:80-1651(-)
MGKDQWEPFWFFEARMSLSRALIGRKRTVMISAGLLAVVLFLLTTNSSSFGLVGSCNYVAAMFGSTKTLRPLAGPREGALNDGTEMHQPKKNVKTSSNNAASPGSGGKKQASAQKSKAGAKPGQQRQIKVPFVPDPQTAKLLLEKLPNKKLYGNLPPKVMAWGEPATLRLDWDKPLASASTPATDSNANTAKVSESHESVEADVKTETPTYVRPTHSKRTSDIFRQPQHICPGTPSKASNKLGSPPAKTTKDITARLLMIADGFVSSATSPATVIGNASCVFVTKPCGHTLNNTQGRWIANKLKITTEEELNEFAANLPDLSDGSLGSCAIVGNSDNMLKSQRGKDIDAHDTIFRHNTPITGFEKFVGERSTIVYMKSKYTQSKYADEKHAGLPPTELAYAELKDISEVPREMKKEGKHIFLRAAGANHFARERRKLYALVGSSGTGRNPKPKHPSGGFARPLNLLASKLCTRIDLYGFSGGMVPGGKYFAPREKVRPAHALDFEHWSYRWLMSQGKLCVYGD